MRVYVPTTSVGLRKLHDVAAWDGSLQAYAVTPALTESYAEGDQEELEYSASASAAHASLGLLAADPGAARRRVVVAVEVAAADATPDAALGPAGVQLRVGFAVADVASFLVDEPAAEDTVRAAVDAYEAAEAGDDDASFAVDEAEGFDLLWYARQELPDLLADLSSS